MPDEVFDNGRFAQVRLRGSTTNDKEIFIGIAPQRDVDTYLQDVAHDEVDHVTFTGTDSPEDVEYRRMGGTGAPDPPGIRPSGLHPPPDQASRPSTGMSPRATGPS